MPPPRKTPEATPHRSADVDRIADEIMQDVKVRPGSVVVTALMPSAAADALLAKIESNELYPSLFLKKLWTIMFPVGFGVGLADTAAPRGVRRPNPTEL